MKDMNLANNAEFSEPGKDKGLFNLQNLLDFSPDIVCALDKEGRFVYVNATAKKDWGYNPEDLIKQKLVDHIVEKDRPHTQQMLAAARSSLVSTSFLNRFCCKNQKARPTLWSVAWNAKEELFYCVAKEGTDTADVVKKATKLENRLHRAYKLAKLGWWEWNIHNEQFDASDELYELYGIDKDEHPTFTSGTYLSLVHPDDLPFVMENVAIFWKTSSHQYQHRVKKPSGEIINVEVNVQTSQDDDNNVAQVHGTVKDITVQKEYEEERQTLDEKLQLANARLARALETMSDGFCTTDRDWTITYMNPQIVKMLGAEKKEDFIGKNLWECFPVADDDNFRAAYLRAAKEQIPVFIEEFYPPLNIWVEVNVYPNANGLSFYVKDITQRKQQEKELLLSNERYQLVTQATSEAIWDWNIVDQQVVWGEGFTTLFGYPSDALENNLTSVVELIHPNDKERVTSSVAHALENNKNKWTNEFRLRKSDGTYTYVVDKGFVIRNEQGEAIRMVGAIQDVTEKKKQEIRLEFMAKATSEIIWEREADSKWVYLNIEKYKEVTGYQLEGPAISQSFWVDKIHPADLPVMLENREYAAKHNLDFYLDEFRMRKANGQWAHMKNRVYVIRDFNCNAVSFLGAMEDVTAQRLFEKTLQESEETYRLLFNNAPLPTIIFDEATLLITDANKAIVEQYGYRRDELLSMTILDLHLKEEHLRVLEAVKEMKTPSRVAVNGVHHVKKNGELMLVEVSATPIHFKGKEMMLATANDVTEKTKLQQQLLEEKVNHQKSITKAAIQAQEKERSEIGKELHDNVNQLLAAAKLYVENIKYVPDQKDYFITQSVTLINKSITETRRLSHALVTPTVRDTGIRDSLQSLIDTYQELENFEIDADFLFEEEKIEPGLGLTIYRILQEAFSNTVKYASATLVTVNIWIHQKKLHVIYTDNGVGFDAAAVKKGIGLRNIINRAEAYQGNVVLNTSPGIGFELNLTFPLEEVSQG
ncbi:MAG TPA: PAS domain S-box protein [Flavisolibacter sp.]|nr:PAS domain S-box protein [Flavisolibacter sp.]